MDSATLAESGERKTFTLSHGKTATLLFVSVLAYWLTVGFTTNHLPNYMTTEAAKVWEAEPAELFGRLYIEHPTGEHAGYWMVAPLGFGLVAALDRWLIAPLVRGDDLDLQSFGRAKRLIGLHALLLAGLSLCLYRVLFGIYGSREGALFSALFVGLNDGFFHATYFVGTIGIYIQLFGAILAVTALVKILTEGESRRRLIQLGIGLGVAVLAHAQSASLAVAVAVAVAAAAVLWRIPARPMWKSGAALPVAALALFLALRFGPGIADTSVVSESQYFFSYPSVLLMAEEAVANAVFHIANTVDSLVFPWPMYSVAVMAGIDMNEANAYNLQYSPWPNMHYRVLGLMYAGLLAGLAVWASAFVIGQLRRRTQSTATATALIGLVLFWFGFLMHVPVMHRDYFIQPGFNVGYKSSLSLLGVALMLPLLWLAWAERRPANDRFRRRAGFVVGGWIVVCAVGKVVLAPGYGYSW